MIPAARPPPNGTLPNEIYAAQVEALFGDRRSFIIGAVAGVAITVVTAIKTGHAGFLLISVLLALLGILRLRSFMRFERGRGLYDIAELRAWERSYVVGGAAQVFLLGLFCLVAFSTEDDFARVTSMASVMAYLVGTPGRGFASIRLVDVQIAAAAVPMLAAMLLAGPSYLWIGALILIPFFVALKSISARLHGIFLDAVIRAGNLSRFATNFDTALKNMPQGLVMFDASGNVIVSNGRMSELLKLPSGALAMGAPLDDLWTACANASSDGTSRAAELAASFKRNASPTQEWVLRLGGERSAAFRLQTMADGGGVILAEDVTERLLAQTRIAYLAQHDLLTGLRNRHSFRENVREKLAATDGRVPALLFIDLDQFKQVNDTLGHVVGDQLVVRVSQRLRVASRPSSVLSRFGGDEFVLFDVFDTSPDQACALAGQIVRCLSEPYEIGNHQISIGASVGVAIGSDADTNVDDLIRDADLALYRAKADGRGVFRLFEQDMQTLALKRRQMEKDLRQAVNFGEFELYYQPIYSLTEKRFVVCEALIRWRHAVHGFVSPAIFIPIAEEIGLIGEIGEWVLRKACSECATWPEDIKVAVNVSAEQFRRGNVLVPVTDAIHDSGIAPGRLEVEITETALIQDLQATSQTLHRLKSMGVGVVLDDFGTGYSSLSYLRTLPFSKVKIDRSFLSGLASDSRAMTMLSGIVRLSNELGLDVVMEGVESADQLALVSDRTDVSLIQGFYFSKPLPAKELLALIGRNHLSKVV